MTKKAISQSEQWMIEALLQLMQSKSYSQITIKDITEKAGVSRLTFYRHFETKEDILKKHLDILFDQYQHDLSQQHIKTLEEALAMCFAYWKQNQDNILAFINNDLASLLYAPFIHFFETILEQYHYVDQYTLNQKAFLTGGLYFAMINYISQDQDISPEKTAANIFQLLTI